MAVPTRTCVAPNFIALSKSPLIPTHAEPGQIVLARKFLQQREVWGGILVVGRNAHQPLHRKLQVVPAQGNEGLRV